MNSMNITSAKYFYGAGSDPIGIEAVINGLYHGVPINPANRHYAEIMRQVEAGELTIQDADS